MLQSFTTKHFCREKHLLLGGEIKICVQSLSHDKQNLFINQHSLCVCWGFLPMAPWQVCIALCPLCSFLSSGAPKRSLQAQLAGLQASLWPSRGAGSSWLAGRVTVYREGSVLAGLAELPAAGTACAVGRWCCWHRACSALGQPWQRLPALALLWILGLLCALS